MTKLKELATDILLVLRDEVILNLTQTGRYSSKTVVNIEQTLDGLQAAINNAELPTNPDYHQMSDLAAELVYFSYSHPEHFASMFDDSTIEWVKDIDVRTADGLFSLSSFLSAIGDDHSFALLDDGNPPPKIVAEWQLSHHPRLVSPKRLLSVLAEYRKVIEDGAKPSSQPQISSV